jgi:suppressor of G2 allele of SKP1
MSHITLAQQGIGAVEKRDWDTAITKLSNAIRSSKSPIWLIARSKAWIGKKDFAKSIKDADLALLVAMERGKRDLMVDAQYRRAVGYFRLKQFANADVCCAWAQAAAEGMPASVDVSVAAIDDDGLWLKSKGDIMDLYGLIKEEHTHPCRANRQYQPQWTQALSLRLQIHNALASVKESDPAWKVTVKMVPDKPDNVDYDDDVTKSVESPRSEEESKGKAPLSVHSETPARPPAAIPAAPKKLDVRIDHYQTDTQIIMTVYAKNVPKDRLIIEFCREKVSLHG